MIALTCDDRDLDESISDHIAQLEGVAERERRPTEFDDIDLGGARLARETRSGVAGECDGVPARRESPRHRQRGARGPGPLFVSEVKQDAHAQTVAGTRSSRNCSAC